MYCTHYIPSVLISICTINKDYYDSNTIYPQYKRHKANTKKNTHPPTQPSPTHIEMI